MIKRMGKIDQFRIDWYANPLSKETIPCDEMLCFAHRRGHIMDQHFFRLKKDYVVKSEGSFTLVSSGTGCLIMLPMLPMLPMIDLSFRRKLEDGGES